MCVDRQARLVLLWTFVALTAARVAAGQNLLPVGEHAPGPAARDSAPRGETLEQAWQIALEVDPQLQAARWEVHSRQADLWAAKSEHWPTSQLQASYLLRSDEPSFVVYPSGALPVTLVNPYAQDDEPSFQAVLRLPLYTAGKIRHGVTAADYGLTASSHRLAQQQLDLKMAIADEYLEVLRSARHLEVHQRQLTSIAAHARDVQAQRKHGHVPPNDLLKAEVSLSDARLAVLHARNRLDAARAAYNRRLGRPLDAPLHLAPATPLGVPLGLEELTAMAVRQRPEPMLYGAEAEALRHQAAQLEASRRPQLSWESAYQFRENRFQSPEGIASTALIAAWQPLDGGRAGHRAESLRSRAEAAESISRHWHSWLQLEVRRAWLSQRESQQRVAAARQSLRQAEENRRAARRLFRAGRENNTSVLEAEALFSRAERRYFDAVYDTVLAEIQLRRAIGDL